MASKPGSTPAKAPSTGAASSSSAGKATPTKTPGASASSAASPGGASSSSSEKKVHVVSGSAAPSQPVKKVTTMKYDLGELKKIREFDDWVTEQLETLGISFEVDFDDISKLSVKEREAMITPKIASIKDQKKREQFKKEFLLRADETCKVLEKTLTKKPSFS